MTRSEREVRLQEEFRLHVELETEANIRRGMSPDAARRAAMLAFGAAEHFKEEARDQFRSRMLAALARDCRYAWRAARRAPTLTVVAIATLAVTVALATTAFTAVNAVLLRTLPYPAPGRLALIWGTTGGSPDHLPVSYTNASDWRRGSRSFESLAMFSCAPRPILAARGEPARASLMEVSADFFRVLQTRPMLGRLFDSTDFVPATAAAVVLTYPLWRDRFGSDPSVINSRVLVDGAPSTVIGVLPAGFHELPPSLACRPDLYRPLIAQYDDGQRSWSFLRAIARLRPGASLGQAQSEVNLVNRRLGEAYPATNRGHGAAVVSLAGSLTQPLRPTLLFVQIGALLVLLVACANVVNLLLARATVRRREFAVRTALGASLHTIARQVGTECLLLGGLSGALGTVLAFAAAGTIGQLSGDALPDPRGLHADWRTLGFAVVATLVATAVFGLATIARLRGDGERMLGSLRDGGRGTAPGRSRTRHILVGLQLALATIAVVGAGLLTRSYQRLREVRSGFDPAGVLTARLTLPDAIYPRGDRQAAFFRQVVEQLSRQPGVIAAGAVSILPESGDYDHTDAKVVGHQYAPGDEPIPDLYRVTPGYFAALRIALKAGRLFAETDDDQHPPVALINVTMATALFPGETAVGKRIWTGAGQVERTVVGVVDDVYQYGLDKARTMQLYVPSNGSGNTRTLVVRGVGDPAARAPLLRAVMRSVDPRVPLDAVLTMDQVMASSTARRRLLAGLSLAFAVGAISLAAIGLYGVIAYSVAQRTSEIGVRMALGASAGAVVGQVIGQGMRLAVAGLAIGLLVAAALGKLMAPLVFGVPVSDIMTFVAAPATLIVVALLASALPAARAARVNPVVALRSD